MFLQESVNMKYEEIGRATIPWLYLAIAVLWFWVAARIPQILPQPPIPSKKVQRISTFSVIVALALCLDASYWMLANLSTYGFLNESKGSLNEFLRVPWRVVIVKSFLLLAAISFYVVLKSSSKALLNETEKIYFSRFVEYTWDAVCITDTTGKVKHWNQGAVNLFGFTKESAENRNLKDFLIPESLHDETDRIWEEIRSTRRGMTDYHALRHTSNGDLVPIDISVSPIYEGPALKGFFGIMREATVPRFRYFKKTQRPQNRNPYAFVIMPFSKDIVKGDVWNLAMKSAIRAVGLSAFRADTETLPEQIMDQVYADISEAKVIIADLTGFNPNVFYELGIAHGIDRPVIQIISEKEKCLPFDIQGIRTIRYDPDDLAALEQQLVESLRRQLNSG